MTESQEGGNVHTSPEEGHPAGDDERSDRDIGGPTSGGGDGEGDGEETGGAPSTGSDTAPDLDPHE
jgi:hypothetical protein